VIGRFNMVLNQKTAFLLIGLASVGWAATIKAATYEGNSSLTVAGKPRESLGECMGVHGGGSDETQFDWQGIGGLITGIADAVTPEIPFPIFSTGWNLFKTIFNSVSGNEAESGKYFDDMEKCIGKMINSAIENDHVQTARSQYKVVLKNLDNFYSTMPKEGTALEEDDLQSLIDYMNFITDNTDSLLGHVEGDRPGYHHDRFVQQALEAVSMEMLAWITFIQRMEIDLTLNSLACNKAQYAMKRIEDRRIRFSEPSSNEFSIQYILDHSDFNSWEKDIGRVYDRDCHYSGFTCSGFASYKIRDGYNDITYFACETNDCDCDQWVCDASNGHCVPELPGGNCHFSSGGADQYLAPYLKNATDKLRFRDTLRSTISKTGHFVNIAYQEAQRQHNYVCNGAYTDIKCGQHPGCGVDFKCIDGECRCKSDTACQTGQKCISGSCVCANDSGCASGEFCRSGACRPDTSSECGNCVPTVDNWKRYLLSDESIAEQTELLRQTVCSEEEDYAFCENFIYDFWLLFAETVYPVFLDGQEVCYNQGSCLKRTSMSCDYCLSLFEGIGENVGSRYKIGEITEFVMATWQDNDMCNGWDACGDCECVPHYIEKGLLAMSEAIKSRADFNCCEHTPNQDCC